MKCVKYEEPFTLFSQMLSSRAPIRAPGMNIDMNIEALLDLTALRAYYLWTSLPAILSNEQ